MAAAPQQPNFLEALAASEGTTAKDLQKNAQNKQYNVKVDLVITETNGNKPYFDGGIHYTGLPYSMVVIMEKELVALEQKLVELGIGIATGGEQP